MKYLTPLDVHYDSSIDPENMDQYKTKDYKANTVYAIKDNNNKSSNIKNYTNYTNYKYYIPLISLIIIYILHSHLFNLL